jgi:hypothetical protein
MRRSINPRWTTLGLLLASICWLGCTGGSVHAPVASFEEARAAAAGQGRLLLVDFYTDW